MRLAALDIGSNTVHVLVADVVRGKLEDVAHYVEMPELGPQVARSGVIGSRARGALRAVRKVIDQARTHGYDELLACATQAIRQASDGPAFVRHASDVLGVPVRIISGRREAALSFLGAASRHAVRREWATADLLACEARLDRHRARHVATLVRLPPNRVKAMRGGVEALLLLLDWYGLALLQVSHEGLRHGMLLAYLERGRDWWRDPTHEIT